MPECSCGVGDWASELTSALDACRGAGRIPRVINVGRSVYEHMLDEPIRQGRFLLGGVMTFKGVRVNFDHDFRLDLIEVK